MNSRIGGRTADPRQARGPMVSTIQIGGDNR